MCRIKKKKKELFQEVGSGVLELENEKLFKVTKILNRGQGPAREGCRGRKKKVGRNDMIPL